MRKPADLDKQGVLELLRDAALSWLTHDGLWFRAVEDEFGLDVAVKLDKIAWEKFTVAEARRIKKRLGLADYGGLEALAEALQFRLYSHINNQAILELTSKRCVFEMRTCRVQEARRRQGLPDFPCKEVGLVEYSGFARAIDPRIETICLFCPPDPHPAESWCRWEFRLLE
ncbi:MAG: DUF6125 family protein [Candidatus Aminicenantales bacterium]